MGRHGGGGVQREAPGGNAQGRAETSGRIAEETPEAVSGALTGRSAPSAAPA